MSTKVGAIHYELGLDTSKFDQAQQRVNEKVSSFSSRSSASFNKLAGVGKVALGIGVAGALAMVAKNASSAIKRVDMLNNAPKVLQNLGFSAEDAQTSFHNLDMGIRGLPTSLDGITSNLVAITGASGRGLKSSTDLTLAFNNMALAGGQGGEAASRAMVQFSQALGLGKLQGQEFNTLMEIMPAQMSQVAKTLLGGSANAYQLRDAMSEGEITMDQFSDAIIQLDKEGGQGFASFKDQAKDATGGIGTAWTNLNTAISRGIANMLENIGTEKINSALKSIGKAFEVGLKIVGDAIVWLSDKEPLLYALGAVIGGVLAYALYTMAAALWIAYGASLPFIAAFAAIGVALWVLKANWDKLTPAIDKAKEVLGNLWEKLQPVRDLLKQVGSFVKDQFISIWESLKDIWKQLAESLQPLVDIFKEIWSKHGKKIMTVLKVVGAVIAAIVLGPMIVGWGLLIGALKVVAMILKWVADHFELIKKIVLIVLGVVLSPLIAVVALVIGAFLLLKATIGFLIDAFKWLWNIVSTVVTSVWNTIVTVFTAIWSFIQPILTFILDLFTIVFGGILLVIIYAVKAIWNVIVTVFNAIWGFIQPIIMTIFNFYKNMFTRMWNIAVTIFNAIWNFIKDVWNKIYGVISGIVQKIIDFFAPAFNWLLEKGKDIIRGLINGIKAMINAVWNAVKAVANKATSMFSAPLKWLYNAGRDIIQGLIDGIGSMINAVKDKVSEVANGIKDRIKGALGINSPSKVMIEVGMQTGQGFVEGIDSMKNKAQLALDTMYHPPAGFNSAIGNGATAQNQQVTTNIYGNITIGSEQDSDEFFRRLSRNQELSSKGLSSLTGTV